MKDNKSWQILPGHCCGWSVYKCIILFFLLLLNEETMQGFPEACDHDWFVCESAPLLPRVVEDEPNLRAPSHGGYCSEV